VTGSNSERRGAGHRVGSQKFQSSLFPNESWSVLCAYDINPISNIVQFGVLGGSMERTRLLPASLGNQNKHRFCLACVPALAQIDCNSKQYRLQCSIRYRYMDVYILALLYTQYPDPQREDPQPWLIHPSIPGCPNKTTGRPTR
jgi:hypothetical protein